MITVRFPSGFSVQYNDLTRVEWGTSVAHLYRNKESKGWQVTVPKTCVIEVISPCRTYNASGSPDYVKDELAALAKEIRSLKRKLAKGGQ